MQKGTSEDRAEGEEVIAGSEPTHANEPLRRDEIPVGLSFRSHLPTTFFVMALGLAIHLSQRIHSPWFQLPTGILMVRFAPLLARFRFMGDPIRWIPEWQAARWMRISGVVVIAFAVWAILAPPVPPRLPASGYDSRMP